MTGAAPSIGPLGLAALWIATLVPGLVALNLPPSATIVNQLAAWAAWGMVATYGSRAAGLGVAAALQRTGWLQAGLLLAALAALASSALGSLPSGLGLSAAGTVAAAGLTALLGAAMASSRATAGAWTMAWAVAGLASTLVACVQVFAPAWVDGEWIARSGAVGRAVGNVRQPNHLASLLLWGAVALVPLVESGVLARTAARRAAAAGALALLVLGVMLSGSRTGLVGVGVLALWGLLDRRLSRHARVLLLAAPLMLAVAWWGVSAWADAQAVGTAIGAAQRVGDGDLSTGRFAIWRDTLALLAAQPLLGLGWGEFNLAWTLTPFPQRSPQFFDHTHNLPLQVLVELGWPLGLALLGLLGWALWQAGVRAWRADDTQGMPGVALRAAFVMVLLMGLHSQLEYPLWYAHFLLPTAFAWGLCLGAGAPAARASAAPPTERAPQRWPLAVGVALVAGAGAMLWDYQRITPIFSPPDDGTPLEVRIARGQRSWFFAHHADYARITALEEAWPPKPDDFRRAKHFLLDARLLEAWARAYAREGDVERARWIADRLRELRQPAAAPFFAPCADAMSANPPFQCTPASRSFGWRDFR
ncbi:MAG TPA: Wzy polymerase domain-containing protein [Burkholderiaceae bacterium]|nr:Wzy polymerase domain-containing protein [Burkholderiaceae bacterium]